MIAILIGSGEIEDYEVVKENMEKCIGAEGGRRQVICCDGGALHAHHLELYPDVIVGDLDSIDSATAQRYRKDGVRFIQYQPEKDDSDMEIGMKYAFSLGAEALIFIGATGSRTDHTLSNIGLLYACLQKKAKAWIVSQECRMTLIDQGLELAGERGRVISLLPLTFSAGGIRTKKLKYPLNDEVLYLGATRGVSNIIEDDEAAVYLKEGILLVVLQNRLLED